MWAFLVSLAMLAAVVIVVYLCVTLYNSYQEKAKARGQVSLMDWLKTIPVTDQDKQDAVDLSLKGGVACLLGLVFPPLLVIGVIPLFYGLRKLLYAGMGLGMVSDELPSSEEQTPPSE
ncbi:MAG: hypothetical protein WBW92_05450 [Rhodanobacteraceae bacterium]